MDIKKKRFLFEPNIYEMASCQLNINFNSNEESLSFSEFKNINYLSNQLGKCDTDAWVYVPNSDLN